MSPGIMKAMQRAAEEGRRAAGRKPRRGTGATLTVSAAHTDIGMKIGIQGASANRPPRSEASSADAKK